LSDRNLLAVALDSIGDPILVHDKDFRILRVNRAVTDRLRSSAECLAGQPISAVLSRNGIPWTHCPYCEGAEGHAERADTSLGGYLLASNAVFRDPSGGSLGTVHVLKDVSAHRRAEEKYRTLFANVREGVFFSTPEGRLLDFNEAFQRMVGYESRDELLKVDIPSVLFVDPADREMLKQTLHQEGSVNGYEFEIRRKNGEVLTVSESSFATRDADGYADAYLGFILDVTARKRAELELVERNIELLRLNEEIRAAYDNLRRTQEQLLQSEKMAAVGQLISGVAHELNNPLTAILGYSQLVTETEEVSAKAADYLGKIHRQAQRTHRIVQNLLSFARQHKPERAAVDLNRVLEDTVLLREYDLRLNNISVHRDFATRLPACHGDAHQLQQVFLNILNNAVDAILEGDRRGDIWVRTWSEGGQVCVELTDSGPGVTDPSRAFDPFYTTKPVGKGTGLGLSICYGIIREHHGTIEVHNAPSRGASFRIALPADVSSALPPAAPCAIGESGATARILLVDDEDMVLDLEKEILRGRCLWSKAVRSGAEAIAFLKETPVDLVVTDLKMPGEVSGEDLYLWIQQHCPAMAGRVIFTMSDAAEDSVSAMLRRTGCPFIQKPFHLQDFLQRVQLVLTQADATLA
jgi:two-component system NtrC family sensor kinase